MQVAKWGNSLAVRLPAKLVEELGLKEGDEIDIKSASPQHLSIERKLTTEELFDRVRAMRGMVPADYKFSRDDAHDDT